VELKKRGIRVLAVCPGWVRTEFFDRAVTDDTITYYNKYFDADEVVARALRDMKIYGAIIGKAYYTGAINLADAIEEANL
jgi:short-subunit dehydrogenase